MSGSNKMSKLSISDLSANVDGKPVLKGISLEVAQGEVHAVMGPNGSGKSTLAHILVGRPGYELTGGSIEMDGVSLVDLSPDERAKAGLFATQQYPIEVPGVTIMELLSAALHSQKKDAADLSEAELSEAELSEVEQLSEVELRDLVETEMSALGMESHLLERTGVNIDFSGGESKRSEALQLVVLKPKIAILDELDSGLDVDAIEDIGARIYKSVKEDDLGVLAITHYPRLLDELPAGFVHVLVDGKIVESGGPELALELEATGYGRFETATDVSVDIRL